MKAGEGEAVFRTAISTYDRDVVRIRGQDIAALMAGRTYGEVVFLLLAGRLPAEGEGRLIEAMLIASSDHGPNPPSTATTRLIVSGNRASLEAAIAGGILAIGDVHGGAGEALMGIIREALRNPGADPTDEARRVLATLPSGRRLPGFGHRTHTVDPRTPALFDLARRHGLAGRGVAFVEALRDALAAAGKPLPINVDGAMAAVLYDLGLPAAAGKALFIIGRVAGLAAHAMEEAARERPMRFNFPFTYDGPEG